MVTDQTGYRFPAYAPVTRRSDTAYEELIEAEFLAAELLDLRQPELVEHRPGWCESGKAAPLARPSAPMPTAPAEAPMPTNVVPFRRRTG
jgi:hypothetical protein